MSDSGIVNDCCGHTVGHAIDCPEAEIADRKARDVWARMLRELPDYGHDAAMIGRSVHLLSYTVEEGRFVVRVDDERTLVALREHAGDTMNTVLSRLMSTACRIKLEKREMSEVPS